MLTFLRVQISKKYLNKYVKTVSSDNYYEQSSNARQ